MPGQPDLREYEVQARSTEMVGRVLCTARNHHFIIDGPVQNGFPGEEVTPSEMFLAAVASCGVELLQMIARQQEIPLRGVGNSIKGVLDRGNPARTDYTVFNSVQLQFHLEGVTEDQGRALVDSFKHR